jgi:hypothetical protein
MNPLPIPFPALCQIARRFLAGACMLAAAAGTSQAQLTTSTINFDTPENWTQGALAFGSYSDHKYTESQWQFNGLNVIRGTTATQDGFPQSLGTHAWRLRDTSTSSLEATYNGSMTIASFGFDVRRWDGTPSPAYIVEYSTNGTDFLSTGLTIDNAYLANSSDWKTLVFNLPESVSVTSGQFKVRVYATGTTERVMIDNFQWSTGIAAPDTTGPVPLAFTPANGATGVPVNFLDINANGQAIASFDEPIQLGTGSITLRRLDNDSIISTIPLNDFISAEVQGGSNLAFFVIPVLEPGTSYYFSVPAGAVKDSLNNNSLAFGTPSSSKPWVFTTATPPAPPSVVVNKFANIGSSAADIIELLVIGNGTAGSTLDMRNMLVKDFSSNMTSDGGGKFRFAESPVWENVPAGTLIVLTGGGTSEDTDASDFVIRASLADTSLFTNLGGSFDIAGTEMIMIKEANASADGVIGGIHTLAGGTAGSLYTSFQGAKLIAASGSATGQAVIANNSTSSLSDYTGTDATGALPATNVNFGGANNVENAIYLAQLRGTVLGNGDGLVQIFNATAGSPFDGKSLFSPGLDTQSLALRVLATLPVTLTRVSVEVPALFGTPATATLSGPAAAGANVVVTGQTITVTGAAITQSDELTITLSGLQTPLPAVGEYGDYTFPVDTATAAGDLTPLAKAPIASVIIPIANLREANASGVPLGLGRVVAVEGVVTEETFAPTRTEAFMQDATAGIALFSQANPSPFLRGQRYAVLGSVSLFNGLTQISFDGDNPSAVTPLGLGTAPTPLEITIPQLLASPETYEGRLVKILNLSYVSGTWGLSANVVVQDANANSLTVRISPGSTAEFPPTFPANITGIFGQFDNSSPFTSGYQILPRDPADLEPGTPPPSDDFAAWIAGFSGLGGQTGFTQDPDGDGIANGLEHYLGYAPNVPNAGPVVSITGKGANTLTFRHTRIKSANLATDVTGEYTWSQNLSTWFNAAGNDAGVAVSFGAPAIVDATHPDYDVVEVVATVTAGSPERLFIRLGASQGAN